MSGGRHSFRPSCCTPWSIFLDSDAVSDAGGRAKARSLGFGGDTDEKGCRITEIVAGGAADQAGLRIGDVIIAVGENSVSNLYDVVLIMRMKKVGDQIPVWFIRDGELFSSMRY